jgi:hypothetical protein
MKNWIAWVGMNMPASGSPKSPGRIKEKIQNYEKDNYLFAVRRQFL